MDDSAMGFIETTAEQAAQRLGWGMHAEESRRDADAHGTAWSLVERAVSATRAEDIRALDEAAFELASSPPMLAAFYQNVDLLYNAGFPDADAVSALIMRALEHSAELPGP